MDGALIPQGLGVMTPWYLNLFENALTVQFDHRMLAYVIIIWALVHTVYLTARFGSGVLLLGVLVQIVLGIATLLAKVPIDLGLAHQAMAVLVFSLALWHLSQLVPAPAPDRR
jgi:cytochrome c oxidase assembly protein subunit 15